MKHYIFIISAILLFSSCNKEYPEVLTVRLASVVWENPDEPNDENYVRYRHYVKWGSAMEWTLGMPVGSIKKFDYYEEGYEWLLKIEAWVYKNPPIDGPDVEYKLRRLLMREHIDSEGIPPTE